MNLKDSRGAVALRVMRYLLDAGYNVLWNERHNSVNLQVASTDPAIGVLGTVKFGNVWRRGEAANADHYGTVTFDPAMSYRKDGHYKVTANGNINLVSLLGRLKREAPLVLTWRVSRAADKERDRTDDIIRGDVLRGLPENDDNEVILPEHISGLSVWRGKVDIHLKDIPPTLATMIVRTVLAYNTTSKHNIT